MKNDKYYTPKISLPVLGILCFVTLLMCQIRFKVTKELSHELSPPITRSKNYWFLYSVGNSDRFHCVLQAFIVISSPAVSLVSTLLLILGKIQSNPYYFMPWLFLTLKGLLLVQTNNLVTVFKDMTANSNYTFGCRSEDLKWLVFYFTFFLIDLVEAFSFCEIFDLFLLLWNRHPGYNEEYANLEAVKKEITDIIENLSKSSSGRSSKISSASITDSDEGKEVLTLKKSVKFSDEKTFIEENVPDPGKPIWSSELKNDFGENCFQRGLDTELKVNTHPDGDGPNKEKHRKRRLKNFLSMNVSHNTNAELVESKAEVVDSSKLCDIVSDVSFNRQESSIGSDMCIDANA